MRLNEKVAGNQLQLDRTSRRKITFSLSRESVSLEPRHVELLVTSLGQVGSPDGDAVADEVSALAVAGIRIDLRLSAGELDALAAAIVRLKAPSRMSDPGFERLLAHVREQQA
jgi:hypothetical protein